MPHLKLLGGTLLEPKGESESARLVRRHPLALLALLVTDASHELTRGKIVGLLWPEFSEKRARARLNSCVYHARRALGDGQLVSSGEKLHLRRDGLRCDVWSFRQDLDAGRPDRAVGHYGGPFMDGFHLPNSSSFEKWMERERNRLRTAYREALESLATEAEERADPRDAARWWQRRFEEDPYDAQVVVHLMDALAAQGKRVGALVAGRGHVRRLAEDLELEPSSLVLATLERVRHADVRAAPPTVEPSSASRSSSIAVLPFEIVSGSEEVEAFAAGLHADLLTDLSRSPSLLVISRTSVLPFRGSERSLVEIGSELGVEHILEGEVQQAGSRVRLRVQLIDAGTDVHLWADRWDRRLSVENLFELQSELTREIVSRLEAELVRAHSHPASSAPTTDLEAYRLHVTARTHLDQRTTASMERAVDLFRAATDRDERYPAAWAGLAEALALLVSYQHRTAEPTLAEAGRAAERAVGLDPSLAEAHSALGLVHFGRQRGPRALRSLYRAVELRPGYAHALKSLALALGPLGFWEEGTLHMERAARLDPTSPEIHYCLGERYVLPGGSVDESLAHVRRAQELSPGYAVAHLLEGRILADSGDPESALAPLRRGLDLAPEPTRARHLYSLARALAVAQEGEARRTLTRIQEAVDPFFEGAALAVMGDVDGAFERLYEAEWTSLHSYHIRYDPALGPMRKDPRFSELLRTVNRAWGLTPDGDLPPPESRDA